MIEETYEFKRGDKVTVTGLSNRSGWNPEMIKTIGMTGTIMAKQDSDPDSRGLKRPSYGVDVPGAAGRDGYWWYHEDDLELYESDGFDAKGIVSRAIGVNQ